ncbi:24460_t:CDS:2, partial [Gigaspora rosea]
NRIRLINLLNNDAPGVVKLQWDLSNKEHVENRDQFLYENGLDIKSDDIRCKWSIRYSTQTMVIKQCICGSYREKNIESNSRVSAARYPYVGCLAFVKISLCNNKICAIFEYLEHSEQSKISQPQRDPIYQLLLYVKKNVETLLNLNVSTADILAQNAKMVRSVFGKQTSIGNSRTLLTTIDITNIKGQLLQKNWGINIKNDTAKNLEQFLGPDANQSELKEACLHYQPRIKETDRLEIIISTREQQKCAWKYGHQNLILIDGTFGVSKNKLLLFIIMVIDENNKGIPISFIIFTPPSQNRLTSSGYDSNILEQLLIIFRDRISTIYNQNHFSKNQNATAITFSHLIAMTNTDVKERKALLKQLGRGGENNIVLQRQTLKAYLSNLLKEAWSTDSDEDMVRKFIKEKKELLKTIIYKAENASNETKKVLDGGVRFFTYLEKQWAGNLLHSWCFNGQKRAAKSLGISLEKLPTTNNHLEELNAYLKNNQINRFQRNNHLLRADVLYVVLVNEIIPNILALRNLVNELEQEKAERRKEFNIMDPSDRKILQQEFSQIAYLAPSPKRDESAKRLLQMNKVINYEIEQTTGKVFVQVESETTLHLVYTICVYGQPTEICCQCLDFLQKGIMCKHLCAAALYIDELRQQEQHAHLPEMIFATHQEAQNIRHVAGLNASAVYEQEFQDFLVSTSKSLHILQENLKALENLVQFNQETEQISIKDQYNLMSHLCNIATSESFKNAQQLTNVMHESINPQKRNAPIAGILPLEQEKKKRRLPFYKSY